MELYEILDGMMLKKSCSANLFDRKRIDTKGPVNQHSDVYFTLTVDNFTDDSVQIDWEIKVEVGF